MTRRADSRAEEAARLESGRRPAACLPASGPGDWTLPAQGAAPCFLRVLFRMLVFSRNTPRHTHKSFPPPSGPPSPQKPHSDASGARPPPFARPPLCPLGPPASPPSNVGLTERRVERGPLGAVSIGRFLGAILSRPFPAGPPPPSHPTAPAPHISPGSPSCQSGASLTPSQFLRIVSLLSPRGFLSPGSCLPCLCFSASYLNPIHGPRPLTWELHSPPTSWVIFPYSVYSVSLFPNYKPPASDPDVSLPRGSAILSHTSSP